MLRSNRKHRISNILKGKLSSSIARLTFLIHVGTDGHHNTVLSGAAREKKMEAKMSLKIKFKTFGVSGV